MRPLHLAPLALLALAGCEKPIGMYRIDKAALVAGTEPAVIERNSMLGEEGKMLRVDLSSETDAVAAADTDLYVSAGKCPLNRRYGFRALGPYPDGLRQYSDTGERRHPTRDARGRYHYVIYLDLAGVSDQPEGYDLRRDPRDVCMRVIGSYMFSPAPRSKVFVLPKAVLESALKGNARRTA